MEKGFLAGLVLGAVGGALLVANSQKARRMVTKSQNEIMQKLDEMKQEEAKDAKSAAKTAAKTKTAAND